MATYGPAYFTLRPIRIPTAFDLEFTGTSLAETGADYVAGQIVRLQNQFGGECTYILGINRSGSAMAQGELIAKVGDASGYTDAGTITGGTTTTIITSSITADDHVGAVAYVQEDGAGSGAAPMSEAAVVGANTTTLITVGPAYSAAIGDSGTDVVDLLATYAGIDAAAADEATGLLGVVVGEAGIANDAYGWIQTQGWNPQTLFRAGVATTRGTMLIAHTARTDVAAAGSLTEDICGQVLTTMASDSSNDCILADLSCGASHRMYDIVAQNAAA